MATFTPTIQQWVLASEGGYVDHPSDPGGATNMGITHRTLAAWRKVPSVSKAEVKTLTRSEALEIYRVQYWNLSGADRLPAGIDYAVFDYAVNSGPARAVKDLQRVLGVSADGIMGAQTLAAATRATPEEVIKALSDRRAEFLRGLRTFPTFGKGWIDRVNRVQRNALSLVSPVAPVTPAPSEGKAPPEKPTVLDGLKDPAVIGAGVTGAGTVFAAIANQPILQIGLLLGIAFLVYRFVIVKRKVDPT